MVIGPGEKKGLAMPRTAPPASPRVARASSLLGERKRSEELRAIERAFRDEGYRFIAGVDEAGRGCLAGPVFAGAVVLPDSPVILGLDDSKVLDPRVRTALAERIRRIAVAAGVGAATSSEIDALGIVDATELAMLRALEALRASGVQPDLVLIDAVRLRGLSGEQRSFVRGDSRVSAIAAASILAKTERDRFMERLDLEYPYYGFAVHRGYGTPRHQEALRRVGPCPVHRLTFDGVLRTRPQET
jgi:ribonuclease HII